MDRYDIAIIGTGPAGLSAAITATIRNKKVLLLGDMRELGAESQKEHRNILEQALKMQTEKVMLVGEEFAKAYKELHTRKSSGIKAAKDSSEVLLFQDTPALIAYLEKNPLKNKTILIKGSHSIGLEKTFPLL